MKSLEIKLEDRLRQMTGKKFLYNASTVQILSHRFDGDSCTVVTSGPWITKPNAELIKVLDDFLDVDEEEYLPTAPAVAQVAEVQTVSAFGALRDILMDNIKKVQADKEYVGQAQVVSHSVKMVIELAKTEISAIKTVSDIRQNR